MKQSIKKKTPNKKSKAQQEPVVFNGTLVGTWKNSNIYNITFDSGAMIVRYGNNEYKPNKKDIQNTKTVFKQIATCIGMDKDKVVVINV